jgi:serine/threonine protein kinase
VRKPMMLGTSVGNYVITKELGAGGMGTVYLAEHPEIGRQVAIKVLSAQLYHDQLAQRFLSEAKAVARIDHENVIDVYDFGRLPDGRLYYVMELLKGKELHDVLSERRMLAPGEIVPYLEQICAGLQAAHNAGIIHRDLKPENIFVLAKQNLRIKILDFGIAKLLEVPKEASLTATGMVMGTPVYIAPEQAAGQTDRISPRTDIYTLGVILYAMLAGRPPFLGAVPAMLLAHHIAEPPPPLSETAPTVPLAVAEVVQACLAKDPDDRPASAIELLNRFKEAVGPGSGQTGPLRANVPPTGPFAPNNAIIAGLPEPADPSAGSEIAATLLTPAPSSPLAVSQAGTAPRSKMPLVLSAAALLIVLAAIAFFVFDRKKSPEVARDQQAAPRALAAKGAASKGAASKGAAAKSAAISATVKAKPKAKPNPALLLDQLAKAYRADQVARATQLAERLRNLEEADANQKALASIYRGAIYLQLNRKQKAKVAFGRALEANPKLTLPSGMPQSVQRAFFHQRCRILGKDCPKRRKWRRKKRRKKPIDTRLRAPAYPGGRP